MHTFLMIVGTLAVLSILDVVIYVLIPPYFKYHIGTKRYLPFSAYYLLYQMWFPKKRKIIMSVNLKKLIEWMESDEGKAESDRVLAAIELERKIHSGRLRKITHYLKTHDFDDLITRLVKEHNEDYRTKCYNVKRCEPYPNNKLSLLLSYVEKHGTEVKHIKGITDGIFSESLYKFKGYYFLTVCGQGCFNRIFNKNKEMILQV